MTDKSKDMPVVAPSGVTGGIGKPQTGAAGDPATKATASSAKSLTDTNRLAFTLSDIHSPARRGFAVLATTLTFTCTAGIRFRSFARLRAARMAPALPHWSDGWASLMPYSFAATTLSRLSPCLGGPGPHCSRRHDNDAPVYSTAPAR
jgi:hypothetical protein